MKRYTSIILIVLVLLVTIVPIAIDFYVMGMFDLLNQVLGPIFWIGVITFLVLILAIIFFTMKNTRKLIQPKTLLQGPDWYRSSSGSKFTMNSFVSSFNRGISLVSLSTASTSSRSSSSRSSSFSRSGGGSSGGGAGRGGGGSW